MPPVGSLFTTAKKARPSVFEVKNVEFAYAAKSIAELPAPTQVEIAFVGRSNVGKSSLLNKLFARRNLARTSSTPGCTRQINFFSVENSAGLLLMLVDLPGYGYASRSKSERNEWAKLIEHYLLDRPTLKASAVLFDCRRGLEADDRDAIELISEHGRKDRAAPGLILVATKADKLSASMRPKLKARREGSLPTIPFSTEEPETTEDVWRALLRAANLQPSRTAEG